VQAYAKHMCTEGMRMLTAQHASGAQCKFMLSKRMSTQGHFDHMLTLLRLKKPYKIMKNAKLKN